jgi:ribosomal protein S18 acetylase RimI-like enzyme
MEEICFATKDDFNSLLDLIIEFEIDKQTKYDKYEKFDIEKIKSDTKKNLKEFLKDTTYQYILYKIDTKIVAYLLMCYDNDLFEGEGYINEVFVSPTNRKKGISKKLMQKGLIWLKENNCKTIDITVNKQNKAALILYRHFGFEKFKDNYISMRRKC